MSGFKKFNLYILLSVFGIPLLSGKEVPYRASLFYKVQTSVIGTTLQGETHQFDKLKVEFSPDESKLLKVEVEVNLGRIPVNFMLDDHRVYKYKLPTEDQAGHDMLLKMSINDWDCKKNKPALECHGVANFYIGKAGFNKDLKLIFDKKRSTNLEFTLNPKEMALKHNSFMGIEVIDQIRIIIIAQRK